jgi:hypothetical protein
MTAFNEPVAHTASVWSAARVAAILVALCLTAPHVRWLFTPMSSYEEACPERRRAVGTTTTYCTEGSQYRTDGYNVWCKP